LAKFEANPSIATSHTGVWRGASGGFNEEVGQERTAVAAEGGWQSGQQVIKYGM